MTKIERIFVKYIVLFGIGFVLWHFGKAFSYMERGYTAVGGEYVMLLLPVIYFLVQIIVRTIKEMWISSHEVERNFTLESYDKD